MLLLHILAGRTSTSTNSLPHTYRNRYGYPRSPASLPAHSRTEVRNEQEAKDPEGSGGASKKERLNGNEGIQQREKGVGLICISFFSGRKREEAHDIPKYLYE